MWYFTYSSASVFFICALLGFTVLVIGGTVLALVHGRRWLEIQAEQMDFKERYLVAMSAAPAPPEPAKASRQVEEVIVLACACGRGVAVNAALALARPGRVIQRCRCGEIVWPPRQGEGGKPAKRVAATRVRSPVALPSAAN